MLGNPSVSQQVSLYIAQGGEEPTSSRAITEEIIGQLYDINQLPEYFDIKPFATRTSDIKPFATQTSDKRAKT
ncbi:hypothetical protein Moror_5651 [Moniliophthora roreri MCA 2997]|uniref:Uncharacterized protein n=1 Tax=Moniliophthora roreri (strain MCA 2997) TaxID=1381753 RepID=V2XTL6_MONRO|nr:hypothetical protein Moror_5651 [Moniliophthora roreri MCA 2997]